MTTHFSMRAVVAGLVLALGLLPAGCAADPSAPLGFNAASDPVVDAHPPDPMAWPRVFHDGGITFSIYQPQIDKWDGLNLQCRAAVEVKTLSRPDSYGVIDITGTTDVDKEGRTVTLRDLNIAKATFPTSQDREMAYLALLRNHVPTVRVISLDHFEASYAMSQTVQSVQVTQVSNTAPRIFFSMTPALLVLVDGPPVLRPMPATGAQRVINTRALILKVDDKFYLSAFDRWYESGFIEGPWALASAPPPALSEAKASLLAAKVRVDLIQPAADAAAKPAALPAILVSTVPAELIQTDGKPNYLPIQGTQLLYVQNSNNAIFLDVASNQFFVLISGRWFKSPSLENGPWSYVAGHDLPGDFARIPRDHPKSNVLVSVPGTPQAQEAVIATSVPQTAAVQRKEAKAEVNYDGTPKFVVVNGVPGLEYAVNTPTPVIHLIGKHYYCVENGVWFASGTAQGPWVVADFVPREIYSIPPDCPLYFVTNVRVYDSTPEVVYVGYTPGYLGACVSPDYTVVYGTGYYYLPWIGVEWIGCPWTYGYGAGFADGFDTGFAFGFSAGVDFGIWFDPWWGPLGWGWRHDHHHHHHHSFNHISIYNHWSGHGVIGPNAPARETSIPRQRAAFNPYSAHRTLRPAAEAHAQLPAVHPAPARVETPSEIYAGHHGEVFRHDGTEWQRHTPQGWSSAEREDNFQSQRSRLQEEQRSRMTGQQRYETNRPSPPPPHGAGAAHTGARR